MEIIYRTFDGKEFDNEADAAYHEHITREAVKMWNREGGEVQDTASGFVVYLPNEEANRAFFAMARAQGDNLVSGIIEGEDFGLFFYDEMNATYRWVDDDERRALTAAFNHIARKEEVDV